MRTIEREDPVPDRAPQRLAAGALVALWIVLTPVLCLIYMTIPPSPDQVLFDYIAWISIVDRPYYVGSFDMNWPGAILLHELGLRIFGAEGWTWRLTDFLLLQISLLFMALFLYRAGFRLAPFVVAVLYPIVYVTAGGWMAGQRDIMAAGLLFIVGAAMLPGGPAERWRVFASGALLVLIVLIRPTYLSVLGGLLLLEALPFVHTRVPRTVSRPARAGLLVAGFAAGVAVTLGCALWVGNLDDWYQQSIMFSLAVYAGDPEARLWETFVTTVAGAWHWMSVLAVSGLFLWLWRDRLSYPLVLVLGLIATFLLSYVVQNKGFGYHLGGLITVMALLIAICFDRLAEIRGSASGVRRHMAGAVLVLAAGLAAAGSAKKLSNYRGSIALLVEERAVVLTDGQALTRAERDEVLSLIAAGSGPEDRLMQYGYIYLVPYLAKRLPSYRYITPAADQMRPDFALHDTWMAEVRAGLAAHPPAFMLFERLYVEGEAGDLRPIIPGSPILTEILETANTDFELVFENGDAVLLRRKSP